MKSRDVLSTVRDRTGLNNSLVARKVGMTPQAAGRVMKASGVTLENAVRFLEAMGYTLYAVPSSLHVEAISDEAIKIEPEERKEKE
ncbi:hypothetical protein AAK706_01535 [Erysipelotrichaceae bacterium 66-17]